MISVAIIINHSVSKEIDNLAGNYFILMKISRPILTKKNTHSVSNISSLMRKKNVLALWKDQVFRKLWYNFENDKLQRGPQFYCAVS